MIVWWLVAGVVLLAGGILLARSTVRVPAGHVGVVYRRLGRGRSAAGARAGTLPAGRRYLLPWPIYEVEVVRRVHVPPGTVGVVLAEQGRPAPATGVLARHVECDLFQDEAAFLANGGQLGRQPAVLPGGAWYATNPEFFTVITIDTVESGRSGLRPDELREVVVPVGYAGVVVVHEGAEPGTAEDSLGPVVPGHASFQSPDAFLNAGGQRGVQAEYLPVGSYRINPWFARVALIPTRVLLLEWASGSGAAPDDVRLDPIRVNVEGHWMRCAVTQIVRITAEAAPRIVRRFGGGEPDGGYADVVRRFVVRVLDPAIRHHLHTAAAAYTAADFLAEQDKIRLELEARLRPLLAAWGVEAMQTVLGEIETEQEELDETRRAVAIEAFRGRLLQEQLINAESESDLAMIQLRAERERITMSLHSDIELLGRDNVALTRMLEQLSKMAVPQVIAFGDADELARYLPRSLAQDLVKRLADATAAVSASALPSISEIPRGLGEDATPPERMGAALARELRAVRDARAQDEPSEQVIAIYLGEEEPAAAVLTAVEELVEAAGWSISEWSQEILGSWFKLLRAKAKDVAASDLAHDIAGDLRRAAELRALHVTQAQVDDTQASAAARLIQALEHTPRAALVVGSLLVVKVDDSLTVRTLSHRHLAHLERNPHLIADPASILLALRDVAADGERPPIDPPQ
ncbi:SPFH domain-containing protein [Sphaerisporangium dianthi]|uniref:SPFH domain-containing protein n=1 Tax=Sphaerisporangium dianthi TaxID=1436120 RepID=A0ABV9CNN6_9ACTN